jgi:hypothetical protein
MLTMMRENKETVHSAAWSAEAINFVEATGLVTPEELSEANILAPDLRLILI